VQEEIIYSKDIKVEGFQVKASEARKVTNKNKNPLPKVEEDL